MNLSIEIIKVTKPEHKAGKGKGYDVIEVTYKDLGSGGKVMGKKLVSFGDYAHVYEVVKDWVEGHIYGVEIQKVDGYWNWVNVQEEVDQGPDSEKKVDLVPAPSTTVVVKDVSSALHHTPAKPAAKQQWVPDEVRQRLIVRQSCLAQAVVTETANAGGIEDILKTAERYVDWVFEVDKQVDVAETPAKRGRPKKVEVEPEVE